MVLRESQILVHLLQERRDVHFVGLLVSPHVAEPKELVRSRQEMIVAGILGVRATME